MASRDDSWRGPWSDEGELLRGDEGDGRDHDVPREEEEDPLIPPLWRDVPSPPRSSPPIINRLNC